MGLFPGSLSGLYANTLAGSPGDAGDTNPGVSLLIQILYFVSGRFFNNIERAGYASSLSSFAPEISKFYVSRFPFELRANTFSGSPCDACDGCARVFRINTNTLFLYPDDFSLI